MPLYASDWLTAKAKSALSKNDELKLTYVLWDKMDIQGAGRRYSATLLRHWIGEQTCLYPDLVVAARSSNGCRRALFDGLGHRALGEKKNQCL